MDPESPWPRAPVWSDTRDDAYEYVLYDYIAAGTIQRVREVLEAAFWRNQPLQPTWKHLQIALLRENKNMAKLLVTYGATPSAEDLSQFRLATGDKFSRYMDLLRRCGHSPLVAAFEAAAGNESLIQYAPRTLTENGFADYRVDSLPAEWTKLLHALHEAGAPEAVIAGDALTSFFQGKPQDKQGVKIFLRWRGIGSTRQRLQKKAFAAAGLRNHFVEAACGPYTQKFVQRELYEGGAFVHIRKQEEHWFASLGDAQTQYHFVFLNDLKLKNCRDFAVAVAALQDVGLQQIACDGKEIVTTGAYRDDIAQKRLTLKNETEFSADRLRELVSKFPDFGCCPAAKRALAQKPLPPPNRAVRG